MLVRKRDREQVVTVVIDEEIGVAFLWGPTDTSLLHSYTYSVASKLWKGKHQGELKLVSHGCKLNKFISHPQIEVMMLNIKFSPLYNLSYETADKSLISVFFERCHRDTNNFYLFVGDMTITCVCSAPSLHYGTILNVYDIGFTSTSSLLVGFLGVDFGNVVTE